uniref:Peroxisomal membrane protein PEX16 n=1 Tax=Heterorhabditis bacteriophora TaxID=37862 RepID=A0A1I7WEV6_HETBA
MTMESTSRVTSLEMDIGSISSYEDAVDESETELRRLCEDAQKHLRLERPRPQAIIPPPLLHSQSSAKHKRSSSSEHSSIEKLVKGREARNRRNHKSSSDHSESPEDWRMINYAFQEVTHYPVLVQINQQLQILSRQLYEIESTNGLQLKIIVQLLDKLIKVRRRPLYSITRTIRYIPIFILALSWPFIVKVIYKWYLRKRQGLAMTFFRYL